MKLLPKVLSILLFATTAAITLAEDATGKSATSENLNERLERILERPEYKKAMNETDSVLDKAGEKTVDSGLNALERFFDKLFSSEIDRQVNNENFFDSIQTLMGAKDIIMYTLLAIIVAILVYIIIKYASKKTFHGRAQKLSAKKQPEFLHNLPDGYAAIIHNYLLMHIQNIDESIKLKTISRTSSGFYGFIDRNISRYLEEKLLPPYWSLGFFEKLFYSAKYSDTLLQNTIRFLHEYNYSGRKPETTAEQIVDNIKKETNLNINNHNHPG